MGSILNWFADASMLDWLVRLLHVAAAGQTLFVGMWLTLPWWRSLIGRALMVKSAALMIYLDFAVAVNHWPSWPHQMGMAVVLFTAVSVGIWSQVFAIGLEMRRNRGGLGKGHH